MAIHVVKEGDSIWGIANTYGISEQRLLSDNGLTRQSKLVIGEALLILIPEMVHTVRPGETLTSIASQYRTTVQSLLQHNPYLANNQALYAGQEITIRNRGEGSAPLTVNGYVYPYVNRNTLRTVLPFLSLLTIFGYGFTENGALIGIDDEGLIALAKEFQAEPIMLLSSITEDGKFSSERASMLFQNPTLQDAVLNNIVATMQQKGYRGLDIDFEFVKPEDKEGFIGFVQKAAERLHPLGFTVHVDLAPKTSTDQPGLLYEAHDYAALGAAADTVLLMTYEWGYTFGPPMAVAPLDQVRRVLEYGLTEIPADKILMGIPNYGYDWLLPFQKGISEAVLIGNQYAVQIAAQHGAEIQFDPTAQSPFFHYFNNGREHVVWFEDARSIQAKLDLVGEKGVLGVGYWNVMRPFTQNWALLGDRFNIRKAPLQ